MDHYDNGPTTKTINKDKICNHDEEHISRSCTLNKCVETLEKNELPHVIFPEHQKNDFSLMSDSKMRCHKVYNLIDLFYLFIFKLFTNTSLITFTIHVFFKLSIQKIIIIS